jgi:RNA polymerase sigma-70 factor (ECF subfamily)
MQYINNNDIELVTLLREGNPSVNTAFNTVYFRFSAALYGFCLYVSNSKEEADELMQDTWMKFYSAVRNGKTTDNIRALLFSIARNLSVNIYRKTSQKRQPDIRYFESDFFDQFTDPFNFQSEMEKDEILKMIQIAVNAMDEKYREVILLRWFGELKFSEIAAIAGESEATVRKRFERAMKQIDGVIKPYFEEK